MDSITLFVLALGLSMDAFAVSISNSMCFSGLRRNEAALTSLSFGVFQGLMPVAGYFAGRAFADVVSAFDHWIAFALLGFIGGKMIWDAVKELRAPEACPVGRAFSYKLMVVPVSYTHLDVYKRQGPLRGHSRLRKAGSDYYPDTPPCRTRTE